MKRQPWTDEWGNILDGRKLERASRYWAAEDWERFHEEYPQELDPCGIQLARNTETAFGDNEANLWDFIGDDVSMPILDKLPELKRVLQGLSSTQYKILRHFYLGKKTDQKIAELLCKPRNTIKWHRWKALKKIINAFEEDKRKGFSGCHISI